MPACDCDSFSDSVGAGPWDTRSPPCVQGGVLMIPLHGGSHLMGVTCWTCVLVVEGAGGTWCELRLLWLLCRESPPPVCGLKGSESLSEPTTSGCKLPFWDPMYTSSVKDDQHSMWKSLLLAKTAYKGRNVLPRPGVLPACPGNRGC
jgi:hypothetical protein